MRMTINLDADVDSFARVYAGAKGISLSAAINELVRRAEQAPEDLGSSGRLEKNEYGYWVIAKTGNVITPEMVKATSEDELI